MGDLMLTPDTIIDAPVLIAPGRPPWTGTIQEAFDLDERMWDTLSELLSLHAPGPEDAIDDERGLAESLADLAHAGISDWTLASALFDDPNVTIIDARESRDAEAASPLRAELSDEASVTEGAGSPGITVYTTPGCPGCQMTHRAFAKAGVEVTVIDLSTRPDLIAQFRREGLTSAPIVEAADGERVSGFRPDRIRALIAANSPSASTASMTGNAGMGGKSGPSPHAGAPARQGLRL